MVAGSWIVWLCLALHVFYLSSVTRHWLSSNSAHGVKPPGGRVSYPPPIGLLKVFLAERGAACGCRTGWIGANHTTLVREESALTTNAQGDRRGCNRVRSDGCARSGCISDVVSALDTASQHGINQVRCRRVGTGARHWTQTCQSARICSVGRRISDCGRLIGRHLGTQQVRNCNGGDDQNDRDHDQQLNQRKALFFVVHTYFLLNRTRIFSRGTHFRSRARVTGK